MAGTLSYTLALNMVRGRNRTTLLNALSSMTLEGTEEFTSKSVELDKGTSAEFVCGRQIFLYINLPCTVALNHLAENNTIEFTKTLTAVRGIYVIPGKLKVTVTNPSDNPNAAPIPVVGIMA